MDKKDEIEAPFDTSKLSQSDAELYVLEKIKFLQVFTNCLMFKFRLKALLLDAKKAAEKESAAAQAKTAKQVSNCAILKKS